MKMKKSKELVENDEVMMSDVTANTVSISSQEEKYAALEAGYNRAEESTEEDLLRLQLDRAEEDVKGQDVFIVQVDVVENEEEDISESVVELEDAFIEEENYSEDDDVVDWGGADDNPYYDDNLDMDQQSQEFWDNL